jgi:hypothetical protein
MMTMKTTILKTAILVGSLIFSANLFAFTAVTSGAWSNTVTWGGIAPGANVTNQDIIIPAGITVDMDMDVTFSGALNTFTVNGTLISPLNHSLWIGAGSFAGNGSSTLRSFTMNSALATYSSTGTLSVGTFSNQGATIPASSSITVGDSLDLSSGTIMLNSGCDLSMALNSRICVDNGTIVASGGFFTTAFPYSIRYIGGTKTMGIEANAVTVQDVIVDLNGNAEDLIINNDMTINGDLNVVSGHISVTNSKLVLRGQFDGGAGAQFETTNAEFVIEGMTGGMNRDFNFSAGSTLSELTINRNATTVRLESALIVTDSIHMLDGTLRMMTGSTLTPAAGCIIYVEDGTFYVTGGTFDGALSYDVIYNGPTHLADVELAGAGLNNLTVELFANASVLTLSTNVKVNGAFNLNRGKVDMGVYAFEAAGTWNQVSGSAMMGSSVAVLHLHMTSVSGDTLWMDPNAKAVSDLVIETPAGTSAVLGAEISVHGQVNFISGKLDIGQGALYVRQGATVNGADDTRYFITSDSGWVHQYVALSAAFVIVPIGTAASYSPIGLHLTSSATPGYIGVRAMDGVYTGGLSGSNMATWETVVDRTWVVAGEANMTMDMHISLRWGAANEANGFDRSNSFIMHYDNGMWDDDTLGSAIAAPFNTYRLDRGPFTNGGAFAVADNSTALSVPEQPVTGLALYPNPTLDFVNVNTGNEQPHEYLYELMDASGKLVYTFSNHNMINQIDLQNYDDGYYVLRITNLSDHSVETKHIVKASR